MHLLILMEMLRRKHKMEDRKHQRDMEKEILKPKKNLTSRFMTEMFQHIKTHGMTPQRSNDLYGVNTL